MNCEKEDESKRLPILMAMMEEDRRDCFNLQDSNSSLVDDREVIFTSDR